MRSHTDGSGRSNRMCQGITCTLVFMQQTKRKYSELDTVLEGPDQLDQALAAHFTQDNRAFSCSSRFHYVFFPPSLCG